MCVAAIHLITIFFELVADEQVSKLKVVCMDIESIVEPVGPLLVRSRSDGHY
jgi:hypothetical protein